MILDEFRHISYNRWIVCRWQRTFEEIFVISYFTVHFLFLPLLHAIRKQYPVYKLVSKQFRLSQ